MKACLNLIIFYKILKNAKKEKKEFNNLDRSK